MELSDAAAFFDQSQAVDAYSDAYLFDCQMDLYDSTERDSETGWRRALSASALTLPARGCIKVGGEVFICGRTTKDFFDGTAIREHLLIHPADGLVTAGTAAQFLNAAGTTQLYAGVSWVKERKFETLTSELESMYDVFCSATESVSAGDLVLDHEGRYLRVAGFNKKTGGLLILVTYDLGVSALREVSYTAAGAYDVASDSSSGTPILIDAVVEGFMSNYSYRTNASAEFERSDKVFTVLKTDVADPKPSDTVIDSGTTFRVLERNDDGASCWEIHARPV